MSPRCVVIVLNFNGVDLLPACLDSLARQVGEPISVMVVDNGSTDGSADLIKRSYPWVRLHALDKNYGFSRGNNLALREVLNSGSEFVLLLNNDTFVAPDFVSQMLATIRSDPRIAVVCPKIYFAHQPHIIWYGGGDFNLWTGAGRHRGWKKADHARYNRPSDITQATGCAMLVRCDALAQVGFFDEQFWAYVEDLDLSIRFRRKGYRLAYAPQAHVWHWDGATAVQARGSGSQAFRQYLSTRNLLLLARKHVRWWQIPTHAIGFLVRHVAFFTALRFWRRDFKALFAIYKGLRDGLSTSLNPNTSPDQGNRGQSREDGPCDPREAAAFNIDAQNLRAYTEWPHEARTSTVEGTRPCPKKSPI